MLRIYHATYITHTINTTWCYVFTKSPTPMLCRKYINVGNVGIMCKCKFTGGSVIFYSGRMNESPKKSPGACVVSY